MQPGSGEGAAEVVFVQTRKATRSSLGEKSLCRGQS